MLSCASQGAPPGGPPDTTAPLVSTSDPDSGKVLTRPPDAANIYFDEVISEQTSAQPNNIAGAVILSPVKGEVRVAWHRDHISVSPRGGFQPGIVYHLELLPVVSDLRNNKLRAGRLIVFSTGPDIPEAVLRGTVVDWIGAKSAPKALVEAIMLPDSLAYRGLADSAGNFRIGALPRGRYLVRGGMDTNGDRRIAGREIFDTVTVDLDSMVTTEIFAFAHDTLAPRVKTTDVVDSVTVKITFSAPLDPGSVLDTSAVMVTTQADTTTGLPLDGVFTQHTLDSLVRRHVEDSTAASRAADSARRAADTTRVRSDSARARPDTTRGRPDTTRAQRGARPDTTRARPDTTRGRANPPAGLRSAAPARGAQGPARPPLDSTLAEKMLARHPAPSDTRIIKLASPLQADQRYAVFIHGVTNLTGQSGDTRGSFRAPRPRPARPGRAAADSSGAPGDSTRQRPPAVPRDSTSPRDSTAPRDSSHVRPRG